MVRHKAKADMNKKGIWAFSAKLNVWKTQWHSAKEITSFHNI